MLEENLIIRIASLGDLTDSIQDVERPLPDVWIRALKTASTGLTSEIVLPKRSKNDPEDRQRALIPTTVYIVKVKPALWNAIKACAKAWSAFQLHQHGQDAQAALLFGAALESVAKLKDAFDKLDPDIGEYCTYISVLQSARGLTRDIGMYPTISQVEHAHQAYRATCTLTSCTHLRDGICAISNDEWENIVNDLQTREILQDQKDGHLWVAL